MDDREEADSSTMLAGELIADGAIGVLVAGGIINIGRLKPTSALNGE